MDYFKSQFDRIQSQLGGLSASQKMLTAALVVIMAMTVMWLGRYAGEAEMEPLLDQSFAGSDAARVIACLKGNGIHYVMSGDRIMVPADRKFEALSLVSYSGALPADTKAGFDEIFKQLTPFDSSGREDKMFNRGKELTLSQVISRFPDVAHADVMIDPTNTLRVERSIEPVAAVSITMKSGFKWSQKLVNSAAALVAGSQSGISLTHINVLVDGVAHLAQDGSTPLSDAPTLLQARLENEAYWQNHIREAVGAPDTKVNVVCKLNVSTETVKELKYGKPNNIVARSQSENTEDTTTGSAPQSDAGVTPNTGATLAPNGSASTSNTRTKEDVTYDVTHIDETSTVRSTPAGTATVLSAYVRVPLSYFANLYAAKHPGAKPPTYDVYKDEIAPELARLKLGLLKATGLTAETDLVMDDYPDSPPIAMVAATTPATSAAVAGLVGGHVKEIGLGGLALMSLFMAMMMVRKSAPVAIIAPPPVVNGPPPMLDSGETVAGEVGSGGSLLDGMELDEEAVRAQQMLDQVSTLVKENPDAAASLVKRWMNRA